MSTPASPVNPGLGPDHVTVFIDGLELAAPKGSMIIQAADKAGIPVPRFCYHEKLPIAANCRMCMVDTELGGRMAPKPSPACATPVADGMKIFTRSDRALKFQRDVMEFLLINHPLDCPICDQGGECELQDVSVGYGRSVSRFSERKRVVPDEDMGPLVATEMTRCIQCTRCVRFTADIAGTFELGGMQRGENLQIGTYDGKPLTTELSGNVIDVCPVGALTNKVFQFRARPWELIARESIGYHDAMGSNLFLHAKRGEVLRAVPRDNESVNECWLSDRDRFSHQGLYAADRATSPMLKDANGEWRDVSWDEAFEAAAAILEQHSGGDLGVLVHPATSNEEGELIARMAKALGTGNVDHRIHSTDLGDGAQAEAFAMPMADFEDADHIVLVGSNIRHELPLLHQRIRKAVAKGAKVHVVNPVDFEFTFDVAQKYIVAPSQLAAALDRLDIGTANMPVVVLGHVAEASAHASALRAASRAFALRIGARFCRVPQGANAVGLARAGVLPGAKDALQMLQDPCRAYVIYGIEPGLDFADPGLAGRALGPAKVIAFSHFACQSTRTAADVILPIGLLPELEATLTNLQGEVQSTQPSGTLPGLAREGWRVLRALGGGLGWPGFAFNDLAGLRAGLEQRTVATSGGGALAKAQGNLEVAVTDAIYRVDGVTRRASALQAHPLTQGEGVSLNPATAANVGLGAGAIAKLKTGAGTAALPVRLDPAVAEGVAWVERGYGATTPLATSHAEVGAA